MDDVEFPQSTPQKLEPFKFVYDYVSGRIPQQNFIALIAERMPPETNALASKTNFPFSPRQLPGIAAH
jgi:hypothetical protein